MGIAVSSLVAAVSVTGVESAIGQLMAMGQASDGAGNTLKALATQGALLAGAALVGVGIKAVQMAGNFQEGMTSLVTGAGELKSNMGLVSNGILDMAVKTGTSTTDLTAGMYMIESAGYHGAAGLAVLQAAAEGAKVGSASLADVANGVTTAMTDYSSSNLTAAQATNALIATVAAGKTHMGDLANSMATILPTSAAVHVGFMDVSGAMATMTGEGTNAAAAATYLRQLLMALASPAKAGAMALKSIGLTTAEVSADMKKSLPDTLQLIMKHLAETYTVGSPQYMAALKNIAGGSKQMQGILELTGDHLKTFTGNVAGISDAVKKGGSSIQGWSEVQGDFNFKISQAKEVVETLMIRIGTALLPVVTQLMNAVIPLITQFSDWITKSGALQAMIGNVSGGLKGAGGVMGDVKGLVMALGGAIANIVVPIANWITKGGALQIVLDTVKTVIGNIVPPISHLTQVVGKIIGDFITWGDKSGFFNGILKTLGATISATSGFVGAIIDKFASFIGYLNSGSAPANALKDALIAVGGAIALIKIGNMISDIIALIPQMIAWIAETWAEFAAETSLAVAEIIANWPIYLIVAAVLALIAIVVLLVQHWGQVIAFLQGAWHAFASWFQGALSAVGTFFSNVWNGIIAFIMGVWNHIVSFVKDHAMLLLAVITGPIGAIVILIVTHWTQIMDFLKGVWNKIITSVSDFVHGVIGWIAHMHDLAVEWITMMVAAYIVKAEALRSQIIQKIQDLVNGVIGWIVSLHNMAVAKMQDVVKGITDTLNNFINGAAQFGLTLIKNIAAGITGGISNIKSAIGNVVGAIGNFLPHSPAREGELQHLNEYGPTIGNALAKGMIDTIPTVRAAISHVVQPMAALGAPGGVPGASFAAPSYAFPSMAQPPQAAPQITVQSPVYLDGRLLSNGLMPHIVNTIRYATGVRGV